MLMSKSRLEKFLYALYSLDSSDLPTPLSRIEELYKCWVAGEEVPTFKPLSRVEKYLMAILGVYNVDELPNPLSRVEVLLYKLATCDDNLDDVKSFLSEHEELLAEIIRNGGVGGDIDIEYVLYTLSTKSNTLYNTAEKPVKSAILKGQTLANIDSYNDRSDFYVFGGDYIDEDGFIQLTARGAWINAHTRNNSLVKPNTKYAIIVDIKENTLDSSTSNALKICTNTDTIDSVWSDAYGINIAGGVTGRLFFTATTSDNVSSAKMLQRAYIGSSLKTGHIKYRWMIIEYQEGMENWDIPYFTGMTGVKMPVLTTTGKNLMLVNHARLDGIDANTGGHVKNLIAKNIPVTPGKTYTVSYSVSSSTNVKIGSIARYEHQEKTNLNNHQQLWNKIGKDDRKLTFTIPQGINYISFTFGDAIYTNDGIPGWIQCDNIQLEEGLTATSYDAFKSNILTVNEDVTLRGIGDVKDELDLITGELTQRVEEFRCEVKSIRVNGTNENGNTRFSVGLINPCPRLKNVLFNNHNFEYNPTTGYNYGADSSFYFNNQTEIFLMFKPDKYTADTLKTYLEENPLILIIQLEQESIKTVDLSVVDRDGNNTKLKTFNDITYVTLSSEGLIPEAELEVATKNEEVLSTMSLEMNDISTTQNALQETSDIQSENVDATMIATTEIYEELL